MNVNKAMLKIVKIAFSVMMALLIIYGTITVSLTAFDFGYRVFTEPAMEEDPGTDVAVVIEEGMGARAIGKELENKGLVRNATLFYIQLELSAYKNAIKPGTYILNTSMEAKDIMVAMAPPDKEPEMISEKSSEKTSTDEKNSGTETEKKSQ